MSDFLMPINELPYNPKSSDSIIKYAKRLTNKTLKNSCEKNLVFISNKGKGDFGTLTEKYYFKYKPNSNPEADFPEADNGSGLELKTSGLEKYVNNNGYKVRFRLSLSSINYLKDYKDNFDTSSVYKKSKNLLIIFYDYIKGENHEDYKIILVEKWSIPEEDFKIMSDDFNLIKNKIKNGKAHELSEGDTIYLGASTSGSGNMQTQPFSKEKAKERRYALNFKYMNHVLANIIYNRYDKIEHKRFRKCIKNYLKISPIKNNPKNLSLNDLIHLKFKDFYNKEDLVIASKFNLIYTNKDKSFYYRLTKKMLTDSENDVAELIKGDIELKAVRIEENNKPDQSISSPAFRFIEDIYDMKWDNSIWNKIIQRKYLFVFFKKTRNGNYILEKFKLWNMPYNDRIECERVWLKTKEIISSGNIFKDFFYKNGEKVINPVAKNFKKKNNFPKKKDSKICHVRPHGTNSSYTFPLPINDKKLKVKEYSKQSFWLSNDYISKIYLNS